MRRVIVPILILLLVAGSALLPGQGAFDIYDSVIRLHVLANSDSEEDQNLKLAVRDAVLGEMEHLLTDCQSLPQAADTLQGAQEHLRQTAEQTLLDAGCHDPVTVLLGKESYPTRNYGDVTLPAGTYTSLRILIGNGEGQNWWCVLFPPLCTEAASSRETLAAAGFTPGQIRILTDSDDPVWVLRFKVLEWLEGLRERCGF